jgi:gas vesicle protein
MKLTKVKNWIFNGLATRHPVKLVVGLVLGAVILSGTALYFGPNQFQEERDTTPGGVTSNELTRDDFRIMEEQRAADRQEDLRFMIQYWNELKKDAATSSTSDNQFKSPLRIMEEQRAADRQEDLRFMIQYWNQLKETQ